MVLLAFPACTKSAFGTRIGSSRRAGVGSVPVSPLACGANPHDQKTFSFSPARWAGGHRDLYHKERRWPNPLASQKALLRPAFTMSSSLNAAHALCMLLLRLQQLQRHVEIGSGAVAISVQVWFKHVPGVRPANTCHLHVPAHRVASSRRCAGDKSTVRPIIWLLEVAVIKHQQHIVGEGITNVMEAQSKTFAKRLLPRSRFRDSMRTTPRWFGAPWSWMIWRMPGLPECKPNGRHVASSGRQSERRDPASPYTEACLE